MSWDQVQAQLGPAIVAFLVVMLPVIGVLFKRAADAQGIVNKNYTVAMTRITALETKNDDLQKQMFDIQVQYAGEKGGLTQKIVSLETELSQERSRADSRDSIQTKAIGALEKQVELLKKAQADLEARIEERTRERNELQAELKDTHALLQVLRVKEQDMLVEAKRLTDELVRVNSELLVLKSQLNGPIV